MCWLAWLRGAGGMGQRGNSFGLGHAAIHTQGDFLLDPPRATWAHQGPPLGRGASSLGLSLLNALISSASQVRFGEAQTTRIEDRLCTSDGTQATRERAACSVLLAARSVQASKPENSARFPFMKRSWPHPMPGSIHLRDARRRAGTCTRHDRQKCTRRGRSHA